MDMDLVVIFAFVSTLVLIITTGVVLFPIARKLGHFLEQAARERAGRLAGDQKPALPDPTAEQLVEVLTNLQSQVGELAERQAFTERMLEKRSDTPPSE